MITQILDTDFLIENRCFLFTDFKQTFSFSLFKSSDIVRRPQNLKKISQNYLNSNVTPKQSGLLFQICVAFSEYLNFINKIKKLSKIAVFAICFL